MKPGLPIRPQRPVPVGVVQGFFPGGRPQPSSSPSLSLPLSGGQPLPPSVQAKMEAFFRTDFSAVRVHIGQEPSRVGALALTCGSHIYFAPGHFDPATPRGERLLAHELAHVVQQRSGRVRQPSGAGLVVVHDPALEAEAERAGLRIARHSSVQPTAPARPASGVSQPKPGLKPPTPFWRTIQLAASSEEEEEEEDEGSTNRRPKRKRRAIPRFDADEIQKQAKARLKKELEDKEARKKARTEYAKRAASIKLTPQAGRRAIDNAAREIHRKAWILEESGAPVLDADGNVQIDSHEKEATTAVGAFVVTKDGVGRRVTLCAMQRRRTPSVREAESRGMEVCDACPGGYHIHAEAWLIFSAYLKWGYDWRCEEVGASQEFCMFCQTLLNRLNIRYDTGYIKLTGTDTWGDPWQHVPAEGPSTWGGFVTEYNKQLGERPRSASASPQEEKKRDESEASRVREESESRWAAVHSVVRGGTSTPAPTPPPRPTASAEPLFRHLQTTEVRSVVGVDASELRLDQVYDGSGGLRYQYKGHVTGTLFAGKRHKFQLV